MVSTGLSLSPNGLSENYGTSKSIGEKLFFPLNDMANGHLEGVQTHHFQTLQW